MCFSSGRTWNRNINENFLSSKFDIISHSFKTSKNTFDNNDVADFKRERRLKMPIIINTKGYERGRRLK